MTGSEGVTFVTGSEGGHFYDRKFIRLEGVTFVTRSEGAIPLERFKIVKIFQALRAPKRYTRIENMAWWMWFCAVGAPDFSTFDVVSAATNNGSRHSSDHNGIL